MLSGEAISVTTEIQTARKRNHHRISSQNQKSQGPKKKKKLPRTIFTKNFGFQGFCKANLAKFVASKISNKTLRNTLETSVVPIVDAFIGTHIQACLGDFTATQISKQTQLGNTGCNNLSYASGTTLGVISFADNQAFCAEEAAVNICVTFDVKTLTFGLVFSGSLIQCMANVSGIGVAVGEAASAIGEIGIGFSLERALTSSVRVAYGEHPKKGVQVKDFTLNGNFVFMINIGLPSLDIMGHDISYYLDLDATLTMMIDFGDSKQHKVMKHINKLTSPTEKAKNPAHLKELAKGKKTTLKSTRDAGVEFSVNITGSVTLNLQQVTDGFIPNFSLNLGNADVIMTSGGGSSGLSSGFYFLLDYNLAKNIDKLLKKTFKKYKTALAVINAVMPDVVKAEDILFGVFFSEESSGFRFDFLGMVFQCLWMHKDTHGKKKGGCEFGGKFLTGLIKDAKWVFKKVDHFFDDVGEVIHEAVHDVEKVVEDIWDWW